jgi:hypothetical protein
VVVVGVVGVVVDAQDQRHVLVLGRRRDQHLLDRAAQVGLGLLGVGEEAGGLDDHVDVVGAPVDVGRVLLGEHLDLVAVDAQPVARGLDRARVAAQGRVVLGQLGQRLGVGQVVDRHELDVGAGRLGGTEHVAADAAETVDTDAYGHGAENLPVDGCERVRDPSRRGLPVAGP